LFGAIQIPSEGWAIGGAEILRGATTISPKVCIRDQKAKSGTHEWLKDSRGQKESGAPKRISFLLFYVDRKVVNSFTAEWVRKATSSGEAKKI